MSELLDLWRMTDTDEFQRPVVEQRRITRSHRRTLAWIALLLATVAGPWLVVCLFM